MKRSRVRSGRIASTPRVRVSDFNGRKRYSLPASVSVPAPADCAWSYAHCAAVLSKGFVIPRPVGETSVPVASGTSSATRARNRRDMYSSVISITCDVVASCARSRANS